MSKALGHAPALLPAAQPRRGRVLLSPPALTAIGLLLLWEAVIHLFRIPDYIAPAPSLILRELVQQWRLILGSMAPTALEAVAGFVIGNLVAISLAVILIHNRLAERCVYPIAVFIHTVPILAIAPILVLVFGTGYTPKIVIASLISFFPTLVNMVRGLKSVGPQTMELMRVLDASRLEVLFKARFQSSLPFLFSALKVSAPACVIGAIVGEWIGSSYGLGAMILEATYNFRAPLLYAAVFACSALALAMFSLVVMAERRFLRWSPGN
jgi:NitT/TauT family transport system permease protein